MRCIYFGIFVTLWTFLSRVAWGLDVDGGVAGYRITYSWETLLDLRPQTAGNAIPPIPHSLRCYNLGATGGISSKKRRRKRGKRGGVQRRPRKYRLDNRCWLPPLPTTLLSNVQSIRNKMDELEAYARCKLDFRDTCAGFHRDVAESHGQQRGSTNQGLWAPCPDGLVALHYEQNLRRWGMFLYK